MLERCCIADLRNKEVINVCDGRRLGCVIDVEFTVCEGKIISLVAQGSSKGIFGKCDGIRIPWCKIDKISEDIILVNVGELPFDDKECGEGKKRRYF